MRQTVDAFVVCNSCPAQHISAVAGCNRYILRKASASLSVQLQGQNQSLHAWNGQPVQALRFLCLINSLHGLRHIIFTFL